MSWDPLWLGTVAALGSAAAWAVGSILFTRLGAEISASALTLAKGTLSVILMAGVLLLAGWQSMNRADFWLLVLSGVLGIALGDTFFFAALRDLGAHAVVTLMMAGNVLTVLLAVWFLGERLDLWGWLGIALVLGGITAVVTANLDRDRKPSSWRGLAFGLASVLCMSASMVVAKRALESISAFQACFLRMAAGTAVMLLFGLSTRQVGDWMTPFRRPRLAGLFVAAVAVVTFGGFFLSLLAVKHLDLAIANTLNATEPVFVLPLSAWLLREPVTGRAIGGTVTAVAGIAVICLT